MTDPVDRRVQRGRTAVLLFVAAVVLLVLSRGAVAFYVESLWFTEVGYESVFWRSFAWVWGTRLAMALLVGGIVYLNLKRVARSLGTLHIRRRFGNLEIAERLPARYISLGVLAVSVLLGLWFGASVPEGVARSLLLWFNRVEWGAVDPFLQRDLGYFVYTVPLLRAVITFALVVGFLVLSMTVAGYATTGTFHMGSGGFSITPPVRRHLGILLAVFLVLLAARFALGRSLLLLSGNADIPGLFGYADQAARLPALRVLTILSIGAAVGVLVGAWRGQLVPFVAGLGALVVGALVGGQLYPSLVQRFAVVPNELERETPYIEEHLAFTRLGYGLDRMERSELAVRPEADVDWGTALERFRGLSVWSASALATTFAERQARFQYYDFSTPTVDRYRAGEETVPVAIAVREVNPLGIEDPNWQNRHLRERFVVGNGAVAVAAAERTPEWGPRNFVAGIPPEFDPAAPPELELEHSSVFFTSRSQAYALVNPTDTTFLSPAGDRGEAGTDFPEGISVAGLLRKLVMAWHLRETNFLFAGEVGSESRLVLYRGVMERVRRIAPFLRYPESPYPVIHEGRVVWIVEGFTGTRYFPLARARSLEPGRPVAYARNSVKIVVDGVTGAVDLYLVDPEDPLAVAWGESFPGLFKPIEEMPGRLREHLRYPASLLNLQSVVLLQYHQETAQTFFEQEEQWDLSRELTQSTDAVDYRPEYSVLQMPGDERPHFQISTVFVPARRDNLTALLTGRLDEDGRPILRLFDLPISRELRGPRQVEALVEQDPVISQQFSLWRQGGSNVWTGHLHVIPVGERVLYVEPIFLAADDNAIPELRRFVVSDGERVAMEETLEEAVAVLAGSGLRETLSAASAPSAEADTGSATAADALRLLELAEARLREGDFAGFGEALAELRARLEALSGGGGSG